MAVCEGLQLFSMWGSTQPALRVQEGLKRELEAPLRQCGHLQELVSGTHFELLGVKSGFEVDAKGVESAYKALEA